MSDQQENIEVSVDTDEQEHEEGIVNEEDNVELTEGDEDNNDADEHEEELVVTIDGKEAGEDEEDTSETGINALRKRDREAQRELRRLKRLLEEREQATQQHQALQEKPKPTLESCGYDEEEYEKNLDEWYQHNEKVKNERARQESEVKQAQQQWQERLQLVERKKSELNAPDFEEARETVKQMLSVTQQGIIIQGAENAALVALVLGRNPKKAEELASIKDPIQFAFAVAKLETQLKVTKRKSAPPPEKKVTGNGTGPSSSSRTLEQLEAEADRTGDRSKVMAFKREQKRAKSA